jgi:hypothetical protein
VVTGHLIVGSTFMPRVIGALEVVAGIDCLTQLWPPLGCALFAFNLTTGVGELVLLEVEASSIRESDGTLRAVSWKYRQCRQGGPIRELRS